MKIGIIGAGNIGGTAAKLFVEAGNEVAVSGSRGADGLENLIAELDDERARAASVEDAARFGEIVLAAIPFNAVETLPVAELRDKIVIDATNYYPKRDGQVAELDNDSTTSSELVERHLRGARVVKAFNTLWSEYLKTKGDVRLDLTERAVLPVAGNDSAAKASVAALIESVGFAAVDTGDLAHGGKFQQPDAPLYNQVLNAARAARILTGE